MHNTGPLRATCCVHIDCREMHAPFSRLPHSWRKEFCKGHILVQTEPIQTARAPFFQGHKSAISAEYLQA
jgi:hypothetical protein